MNLSEADPLTIGAGLTALGFTSPEDRGPQDVVAGCRAHDDVEGTWHLKSDIADQLRLGIRVRSLAWSSPQLRWTMTLHDIATGEVGTLHTRGTVSGTEYIDHANGHRPMCGVEEGFARMLVHAQEWPQDRDYAGKPVAVVGSPATAVAVAPALLEKAELVSFLQRSPRYILRLPSKDPVFSPLQRFMAVSAPFQAMCRVSIPRLLVVVGLSRRHAWMMRWLACGVNSAYVSRNFDGETHLNWDGRATIATATIEWFVPKGIELTFEEFLPADIVVAATNLKLLPFEGLDVPVDGEPIGWPGTVPSNSVMHSDVPITSSNSATPTTCRRLRPSWPATTSLRPLDSARPDRELTIDDLASNYALRADSTFPRQSKDGFWSFRSHDSFDLNRLAGSIDGGDLEYGHSAALVPGGVAA